MSHAADIMREARAREEDAGGDGGGDPAGDLAALRRSIAAIERGAPGLGPRPPLPLGLPEIDARLAGGLARGALHLIHDLRPGMAPAAAGFAAMVLALAARAGPVGWIMTETGRREDGRPCGAGLSALGLDPSRLLSVTTAKPLDALWAAEEMLAAGALSAILLDLKGAAPGLDLTASRRLALAAERGGGLGLILRTNAPRLPLAAATRFLVAPAASRAGPLAAAIGGLGPPRLALALDRNRSGSGGAWEIEWTAAPRPPAMEASHESSHESDFFPAESSPAEAHLPGFRLAVPYSASHGASHGASHVAPLAASLPQPAREPHPGPLVPRPADRPVPVAA